MEQADGGRGSPSSRRLVGGRGASSVEAALALPLAFLLILGMLDVGNALKTRSTVANAARAGGRAASVAGSDPMADATILRRIDSSSAAIADGEIQMVVVWHATGPGDQVPAACVPPVPAGPNLVSVGVWDGGLDAVGACNVYLRPGAPGGAFDMAAGRLGQPAGHFFGCEGAFDAQAAHKVDCRWPGKNRRTLTSSRNAVGPARPPDYVGVELRIAHRVVTERLGATLTMRESTINMIEPEGYDLT